MLTQSRLDLFTALNVLERELGRCGSAQAAVGVHLAGDALRRGWAERQETPAEHIRNALQILSGLDEQLDQGPAVAGGVMPGPVAHWLVQGRRVVVSATELAALRGRLTLALAGLE